MHIRTRLAGSTWVPAIYIPETKLQTVLETIVGRLCMQETDLEQSVYYRMEQNLSPCRAFRYTVIEGFVRSEVLAEAKM